MKYSTLLLFLTISLKGVIFGQSKDPQPGDVFKDFFAKDFSIYNEGVTSDSGKVIVNVNDLEHAIRAELSVIESHAHIGTSRRSFNINNGIKRELYKPIVPGNGNCYHYQHYGRAATAIPVAELKQGNNVIKLFLGKQECYGFNWPGWGAMGGVVLRIYYNPNKKTHPKGEIVTPLLNSEISDNLIIRVKVKDDQQNIAAVDVIGNYYGYPFDGTEKFQNWHYHYQTGSVNWQGQVGRKTRAPYDFYWNLKWIPDQDKPIKIAARITDNQGISFITPAVEGLTLTRKNQSVKMYVCPKLPEKFQTRLSEKMSCNIPIADDIKNSVSALVQSIIWPGHLEGEYKSCVGLNGNTLDSIANTENSIDRLNYFPHEIPIPVEILKNGENEFFIYSDTQGHMTEIYWPGPAILVRYKKDII